MFATVKIGFISVPSTYAKKHHFGAENMDRHATSLTQKNRPGGVPGVPDKGNRTSVCSGALVKKWFCNVCTAITTLKKRDHRNCSSYHSALVSTTILVGYVVDKRTRLPRLLCSSVSSPTLLMMGKNLSQAGVKLRRWRRSPSRSPACCEHAHRHSSGGRRCPTRLVYSLAPDARDHVQKQLG